MSLPSLKHVDFLCSCADLNIVPARYHLLQNRLVLATTAAAANKASRFRWREQIILLFVPSTLYSPHHFASNLEELEDRAQALVPTSVFTWACEPQLHSQGLASNSPYVISASDPIEAVYFRSRQSLRS